MHEDAPVLNATTRTKTGSRAARAAREAGRLPAVVYGHKQDPVSIELNAHETLLALHRGEKVFQLDIEGVTKSDFVLVKDIQYDYLGTNIVHCDLERVDLDERVVVTVQLHIIGENDCVGLKSAGAILMRPITELELECAVTNLPDSVEVDIRNLEANGSITAKDVELPKPTMKLMTDPDGVVAQIMFPAAGADDSDEAATVADGASPEVLTEKKED